MFAILLFASGYSGIVMDMLGSTRTASYAVFDGLIIVLALMSIAFIRMKLAIVLLFIVGCIVFNLAQKDNDILYSLNGLREIINILCFAVYFSHVFDDDNEEQAEKHVELFKNFSFIFLISQLPAAAYQFSVHGPSDWVGGTYGNLGTGNLTLSVICQVFFMSHFVRNRTQRALLYLCLIPLVLNETKVSFILIPTLMLFIHFQPKVKSMIGAGLAAGLALWVFNTFFTTNMGNVDAEDANLTGLFSKDFIDGYLFGDIYTYTDVPRFTKIILAWQMLSQDTITFLFGFEYGIFRSTEVGDMSQFSQTMQWLMVGTRPYLFFLMIQGGLLLVVGFLWLMLRINHFFTERNNKFKTFLFFLFLVILFYNDALRSHNIGIVYFFCVFYANSRLYNEQQEELA